MPSPDAEFPADPYPGVVPPWSFVHLDGLSHPLVAGPWRIGEVELDYWLAARGCAPLAARAPVLAYGSNRCPSKITWLRREVGLAADPVVVLRVTTTGVAAVWAAGLRRRDGQRPAVLVAAPAVTEQHSVWLATPNQVEVLDRCEGAGYRRVRLDTGEVTAEDGADVVHPWTYLGATPARAPLLVDGSPVRCHPRTSEP